MYELAIGVFFVFLIIGGIIGILSYFHLNGENEKEKDNTPSTPNLESQPEVVILNPTELTGYIVAPPNFAGVTTDVNPQITDAVTIVDKPKKKRYYKPKAVKKKPIKPIKGKRKPIKKKPKGE